MALTREQILRAGLEILDEYGLADLSMRRIAARLDVQAGALYHHVPNKQSLLAGVATVVLGEVDEPLGPWRSTVTKWAQSLRATLLAHRDSAELVTSARGFRLLEVDVLAHPVTILSTTGLTTPTCRSGATAVWHFTTGHVAEEHARRDWRRYIAHDTDTTDDDGDFRAGLDLILDGLRQRIPAGTDGLPDSPAGVTV